jgi:hypothetical protein
VATTSALTGPFTVWQICLRIERESPFSFAISDGLVVTPSRMPIAASASISFRLPVSTNSFIGELRGGRGRRTRRPRASR